MLLNICKTECKSSCDPDYCVAAKIGQISFKLRTNLKPKQPIGRNLWNNVFDLT